jgi:hypothetical protein
VAEEAAIAAALLVVFVSGCCGFTRAGPIRAARGGPGSWLVTRIEWNAADWCEHIASRGQLGIGEWLETDAHSRAQIAVGTIGNVDIDENTRVRLVATQPTEHRLELERGRMSARIWAPPRCFSSIRRRRWLRIWLCVHAVG